MNDTEKEGKQVILENIEAQRGEVILLKPHNSLCQSLYRSLGLPTTILCSPLLPTTSCKFPLYSWSSLCSIVSFPLTQLCLYSLPHFLQNELFSLAELSLFLQAQLNCNIRIVICII